MVMRSLEIDDAGGSLVEFALVTSILVMLLIGTTQFGLMLYQWSQVNRLVHEGAFYVMKNADALYDLNNRFSASAISTAVGSNALGDTLTVSGGCACPKSSGITAAELTAFSTSTSKCPTALTCNGNTAAPVPYVILSAQHTYTGVSRWVVAPVSARAVVRIQ
jgi:Flp pilus assembly protein TadG